MASEVDVAWAAGLFEGEGCFSLHRNRDSIIAALTTADNDVLERFAAVMGGGKTKLKNETSRTLQHHKPLWIWWSCASEAERCVRLLLPHLGRRRSDTILVGLEMFHVYRAASTIPRLCHGCQKVFAPKPSASARRTRFCSTNCRERVRMRHARSLRHADA